jgi:hypothetical protein
MCNERISEVITSCHCKKITLKIFNLNPRFTVCHCSTCQLIHNGPWYGADCSDIKIIDGKEFVKASSQKHGEKENKSCNIQGFLVEWHFCAECGSRLYYSFDESESKDKYNVSTGLLHQICEDDLIMEAESFFDKKPSYYSFHETKKFAAGDICKKQS